MCSGEGGGIAFLGPRGGIRPEADEKARGLGMPFWPAELVAWCRAAAPWKRGGARGGGVIARRVIGSANGAA